MEQVTIDRLASLCRLWGIVEFLHPWIACRDIDWDAAAVEAAPAVLDASSDEEFQEAVERMLSHVGDEWTTTRPPSGGRESHREPADEPVVHWTEDRRVAVIAARDFAKTGRDGPANALKRLQKEAHGAEGIVWDLRQSDFWFNRVLPAHVARYLESAVRTASSRVRMHSGYRGPGTASGGYHSGVLVQDAVVLPPPEDRFSPRPQAFVVDESVYSMDVPAGLQAAGLATVVAAGPKTLAPQQTVQLAGGVTAYVRVGELVDSFGRPVEPAVVAGSDDGQPYLETPAIRSAVSAVLNPKATGAADVAPVVTVGERRQPAASEGSPSVGQRLLGLFRLWNVVRYFFPYRHLMDRDWDDVLPELIPKFVEASSDLDYGLAVCAATRFMQDTHSAWVGSSALNEHRGRAEPPVTVRTLRGEAVVLKAAEGTGLEPGDVVLSVDGEDVGARRDHLVQIMSASTPQGLTMSTDRTLLRGPEDTPCRLRVRRGAETLDVSIPRSLDYFDPQDDSPVWRVLSEGVAYVDLLRLEPHQVDEALAAIAGTPGVVFDVRGYPRGALWPLESRLAREPVVAAKFRRPELRGPSETYAVELSFDQMSAPDPDGPEYRGRVVALIDERAISHAEHTCLFLEAAAGAKFVGSPTTGANGDVTSVLLPGGVSFGMTGHDVRHGDGRQLQRVGILPDLEVYPTVEGIRDGRDEVLQAGVQFLLRELEQS
ncbi:MAG TPA: S41 family peptidase [Actinomycetota bacterium]|nr:S41 family peptidase [Actinomycetota bacterium]